jgi:hypothetical protein
MPKVIGYDNSITKKRTCGHCGAINEYTPNEIKDIRTNQDYLGGYELYKGFNCAGCGKEIFVK